MPVNTHVYFSFLGLMFFLVYTPGPNVLLMVRNGLEYRLRDAFFSIPGIILAILTYAIFASFGFAHLLSQHPESYRMIRLAGSVYLIYLGLIGMKKAFDLKKNQSFSFQRKPLQKKERIQLFNTGYLCAITNPKILIFYLTFFPQFIDPQKSPTPQLALLITSHILITSSAMVFYCTLANHLQKYIEKYSKVQYFFTNSILIVFGIFILLK